MVTRKTAEAESRGEPRANEVLPVDLKGNPASSSAQASSCVQTPLEKGTLRFHRAIVVTDVDVGRIHSALAKGFPELAPKGSIRWNDGTDRSVENTSELIEIENSPSRRIQEMAFQRGVSSPEIFVTLSRSDSPLLVTWTGLTTDQRQAAHELFVCESRNLRSFHWWLNRASYWYLNDWRGQALNALVFITSVGFVIGLHSGSRSIGGQQPDPLPTTAPTSTWIPSVGGVLVVMTELALLALAIPVIRYIFPSAVFATREGTHSYDTLKRWRWGLGLTSVLSAAGYLVKQVCQALAR